MGWRLIPASDPTGGRGWFWHGESQSALDGMDLTQIKKCNIGWSSRVMNVVYVR